MRRNPLGRPRFSLLQAMKSVLYVAVAFGCSAPMLNLWRAGVVEGGTTRGLIVVALFEAIVVPLVWTALTCVVIRRSPRRDGLIAAFLFCSVSVAFGLAIWLLIAYSIPSFRSPNLAPGSRIDRASLVAHVLVIFTLLAAARFLALRVIRAARTSRDVPSVARNQDV